MAMRALSQNTPRARLYRTVSALAPGQPGNAARDSTRTVAHPVGSVEERMQQALAQRLG